MSRAWLLIVATTTVACVAPRPSRVSAPIAADRGEAQSERVVAPTVLASSPLGRPLASAPPDEDAPPRVELPPGVECAIHGTGAPFADGCHPHTLEVVSGRSAGRALARVRAQDVDLTWGFFETPGRAWLGARSNGVRVEGFVDTSEEDFGLRGEIVAVDAHVWFAADAPVRVVGSSRGRLRVAVADDLPGVSSIVAQTSCEAVHYETSPRRVPSEALPVVASEPVRFATTTGATLPIRYTPGGPVRAILGGAQGPLDLSVGVVESHFGYSRVTFETHHARFDVWVDDRQLSDEAFGVGGLGAGACGGIGDYAAVRSSVVQEETAVSVGVRPGDDGPRGVTLEKGARVRVGARERGFVSVTPFGSAIEPPARASFWIPERALTAER